jgi:hypothetical protein
MSKSMVGRDTDWMKSIFWRDGFCGSGTEGPIFHHGDLFDVSELRKGMESMASLYSRVGIYRHGPLAENKH